jgi:HEAT repeat protein
LKALDRKHRQTACDLAGGLRLSQEEIVTGLVAALADSDARVRQSATTAIWRIGYKAKKAVPALTELLKSGTPVYGAVCPFEYPRDLGLLALAEMKTAARPAVPVMVQALARVDLDERLELYRCLASLGPHARDAIPTLQGSLTHKSIGDRFYAAAALLCIDPDNAKAANFLLTALKSKDRKTQGLALGVCRDVGPRVSVLIPALITALKIKTDSYDRLNAAIALGKMGSLAEPAITALEVTCADRADLNTPRAAALALGGIGTAALPALRRMLQHDDSWVRCLAAAALGEPAPDVTKAVPLLTSALNDKDELVRLYAAMSLGRHKKNAIRARDSLMQLSTTDQDRDIRIMASWAITQLGR